MLTGQRRLCMAGLPELLCFWGLAYRNPSLTLTAHRTATFISFFFRTGFGRRYWQIRREMQLPAIYASVLVIAPRSSGEDPGDEGFQEQVYRRLRGPPFHSPISLEEQVWLGSCWRGPSPLPEDTCVWPLHSLSFCLSSSFTPNAPNTHAHTHACTLLHFSQSKINSGLMRSCEILNLRSMRRTEVTRWEVRWPLESETWASILVLLFANCGTLSELLSLPTPPSLLFSLHPQTRVIMTPAFQAVVSNIWITWYMEIAEQIPVDTQTMTMSFCNGFPGPRTRMEWSERGHLGRSKQADGLEQREGNQERTHQPAVVPICVGLWAKGLILTENFL